MIHVGLVPGRILKRIFFLWYVCIFYLLTYFTILSSIGAKGIHLTLYSGSTNYLSEIMEVFKRKTS